MRLLNAVGVAAILAACALAPSVRAAEETFDACDVFTAADAEKALGVAAAGEPVNPKVRRPKVIPNCTYKGFKDSKPVAATVQFKWGKTNEEAQHAFDEARLQFQTKPMLISGVDAFWSAKTGQMNIRKGRTWLIIAVGPERLSERDLADAKKLAELLIPKL